jgi:flagellar biosynthesis protein FlhF
MAAAADQPTSQAARYRIVVRSAAEAVALVRDRFGPQARVVAVRQIEAGGLARFLQKPRLEVVVEVPSAQETPPAAATSKETAPATPDAAPAGADAAAPAAPAAPRLALAPRHEISVLRAMGFDDMLLERIRADEPAIDRPSITPAETLGRLAAWLRRAWQAVPRRPAGPRRVFFGSCGSGKTTALCKMLATDVFVHGREAAVLKLDGDQPNASDGLAAFCEVMGVPLLRSAAEVGEFGTDALLYIDVPGVGLDAHGEQSRLAQTLDALAVDTRVLVVNAACETEVIAAAFEAGRACGATHLVFTHLDEVRRPGKLWRFVLFGGLRPLLLGAGPSPAGEAEDDVFGALLARTFPPELARMAGAEGGRT